MHRRWLSWTLLSSSASAFYPYYHPGDEETKAKRFYPIRPGDSFEDAKPFALDIKRVHHDKRDNNFPVIFSSEPTVPNGLAINEDGQDFSYFSTLKFGSRGEPMYMLIDTGSANSWVFASDCLSSACQAHNTFGAADSATLNVTTEAWTLTYGTGEVTGVVASDTVAFANYSLELGFGLAQTASDDFNFYPMDGILGLGRQSSDVLSVPTIMDELDAQGSLRENIIGVHLQRASSDDKDGQITFGDVDSTKFDGTISYTNSLVGNSNWEIPVDDAGVDGNSCHLTGKTAIIDTGTSYVLMPLQDALQLHQLIPGANHTGENFVIPCNATAKVHFTFSGITYNIGPADYVGKASGGTCQSNIVGHQAFGPDQWILGDVFLKNVYTVFDFDKDRIGFGVKRTPSSTTDSITSSSTPSSTTTAHAASTQLNTTTESKTSSATSDIRPSSTTARSSTSTSGTSAATATVNSSPFGNTSIGAPRSPIPLTLAVLVVILAVLCSM